MAAVAFAESLSPDVWGRGWGVANYAPLVGVCAVPMCCRGTPAVMELGGCVSDGQSGGPRGGSVFRGLRLSPTVRVFIFGI